MTKIIKSKGRNQLVGQKPRKIGIISGTFDPVHKGHIAFALEAVRTAKLDLVYFLPNVIPQRKNGATHYAHRVAMLKLALLPHQSLRLLELADKQFSVAKTLPKLRRLFPQDDLHLLVGSDVLEGLRNGHWSYSEQLLSRVRLIVGVRAGDELTRTHQILATLQPHGLALVTDACHASSRLIRDALRGGDTHHELLPSSLKQYIAEHWLYVSLESTSENKS
jgi:nicotinate-nucleotide adenylyltransferase